MSTLSLLLTDFTVVDPARQSVPKNPFSTLRTIRLSGDDGQDPLEARAAPKPKLTPADLQAEAIKVAVQEAREAEREIARLHLDNVLAAENQKYVESLTAERAAWATDEGSALALQLRETLHDIEERLSGRIANILRPFMAEAFRQQAMTVTKTALSSILSDPASPIIKVTGPKDVLDELRKAAGDLHTVVEFIEGSDSDVSIAAGSTLIETQLTSWAERLRSIPVCE